MRHLSSCSWPWGSAATSWLWVHSWTSPCPSYVITVCSLFSSTPLQCMSCTPSRQLPRSPSSFVQAFHPSWSVLPLACPCGHCFVHWCASRTSWHAGRTERAWCGSASLSLRCEWETIPARASTSGRAPPAPAARSTLLATYYHPSCLSLRVVKGHSGRANRQSLKLRKGLHGWSSLKALLSRCGRVLRCLASVFNGRVRVTSSYLP